MRSVRIGIVSLEQDLHALIIQKALNQYQNVQCCLIESNRICGSTILTWSPDEGYAPQNRVPAADLADGLDVGKLNVIWWRRAGFPQAIPDSVANEAQIEVINNDCRAALLGSLLNDFHGTWINDPVDTQLAQNKLIQLNAARQAGFRIPRTLVSQNPAAIREFCEKLDYKVIVKSIVGSQKTPLLTMKITPDHLLCDESIALCPAIYQEHIPGDLHVRAQCFGDEIYAVTLKSEALDWRPDLNIPFEVVELDTDVKRCLQAVLNRLGLKMGIVDLKFAPDGELVWFEINPQGQFLFVQGLSGIDLTSAFAKFLYEEATRATK